MSAFKKYEYYILFFIYSALIITVIVGYLFLKKEHDDRLYFQQKFREAEKQCIVTALYHEARGEGEFGMKAVANVIDNRYRHPKYPDTYCGVINQHKQFSYTLEDKPEGKDLVLMQKVKQAQEAFETAEKIAEDMLDGKLQKFLPDNALHYARNSVNNYWTKTKKVIAQIGNHKFYVEKAEKEKK